MPTTKELERKIKQKKFSLDQGFSTYTDQNQNTATQPPTQPATQQNSVTAASLHANQNLNLVSQPAAQPSLQQNSIADTALLTNEPEKQVVTQQFAKPAYARKVTLYLTEDLYKAFNDIYATRLLRGRATEKSALVCEAIGLLFEKEKNDGHM